MHAAPRDCSAERVLPYASVAFLSAGGAATSAKGRALSRFSHELPGGSHSTWPGLNPEDCPRLLAISFIMTHRAAGGVNGPRVCPPA
jgi:hypothetical protein